MVLSKIIVLVGGVAGLMFMWTAWNSGSIPAAIIGGALWVGAILGDCSADILAAVKSKK